MANKQIEFETGIKVDADSTFTQNVTVTGTITSSNPINAPAGNIAGGTYTGNLTPSSNGINLGNTTARWNVFTTSITASGDATVAGNVAVNGSLTVGSSPIDTTAGLIVSSANGISFSGGNGVVNVSVTVTRGAANTVAVRWNEVTDKWVLLNADGVTSNIVFESGTYNISITGSANSATTATTANDSSNFAGQNSSFYTNIVARLGYTPANKAGDTFTGTVLVAANGATINAFSVTRGAANTVSLRWEETAKVWQVSKNDNTFANVVIADSGTYAISVTGSAASATTATNATQLNGQAASYYTDIASRLGYTPANKAGDTFTGAVQINGALNVTGDVTAFYSSDIRLKENIRPLSKSLGKLTKLNGVSFTWKPKTDKPEGPQIGLIAQEVEQQFPELVHLNFDILHVDYVKLIPVLIEAIKELDKEVTSLKKKIASKKQDT